MSEAPRRWLVDGTNVFGSRPDGWWRDRRKAARRLVGEVTIWADQVGEPVTVVLDQPVPDDLVALRGTVEVRAASRSGRDAADDDIVALAEELAASAGTEVVVVSSDRGLRSRLPPETRVEGAGSFLRRLAGP